MRTRKIICSAFAAALLPLLTGCTTAPGTIRGQSPSGPAMQQIGNHYFQPGHPYAQLAGHSHGHPGKGPGCPDGSCGSGQCATCNSGGKGPGGCEGCASGQCGAHGHHGHPRHGGPYGGGNPYGGYPPAPYPGAPYPGAGGAAMFGGPGGGMNGLGNVWHPTHYHTFTYHEPKNLVYPPQNQPAGVVQYPYYTVKGPSDFFMQ